MIVCKLYCENLVDASTNMHEILLKGEQKFKNQEIMKSHLICVVKRKRKLSFILKKCSTHYTLLFVNKTE